MQVWNDPAQLRSLSNALQWPAIALVFLGGLLQLARFTVDRREKTVTSAIQEREQKEQKEREAELRQKMSGLEVHIGDRQKEIAELKSEATDLRVQAKDLRSKAESLDPLAQTIKVVTATAEVVIASRVGAGGTGIGMNPTGFVAFVKGESPVMVLATNTLSTIRQNADHLMYRSVFNLDASSPIIGKAMGTLKESDRLLISFEDLRPNERVTGGRVVLTINSAVRLEFEIPQQVMDTRWVVVRNLASQLAPLK